MWEQLKSFDGWATAILATALLSVAVWVLVFALGYHKPPASSPYGYEPYFEQRNWWPLPFVFLALAPGLWLNWKPMLRAWSKLAETGVLLGSGGKPDDATVQQVLGAIRRQRRGAALGERRSGEETRAHPAGPRGRLRRARPGPRLPAHRSPAGSCPAADAICC